MSVYQLWSRDEYGQGSILFTSEDIKRVLKEGKNAVTDINVNNSLTADDRERNWEAYMIMIDSSNQKSNMQYVYGGGDPRTKNIVYSVEEKEEKEIKLQDIPNPVIRVYLGNISTKRNEEVPWFAKDARRNLIESVDHQDLQGKTQFFVKRV
jgi:hypothetical protein